MDEWQSIKTAPRDGTKVRLRHSLCMADYENTGFYDEAAQDWIIPWFYVHKDGICFRQPDQWKPLSPSAE